MRPASRMLSAISFGVFWRAAPSTSAIMRSRNDSPGLALMRTTSWSESTRVPPVTARAIAAALADHRRGLAGDGRLVDARDALDHVAVAGDQLAGLDDHHVALAQRRGRDRLDRRRRAGGARAVSLRILRSVSAWALPRPSAIASAKFAKSTVNHSQSATDAGEPERRRVRPTARTRRGSRARW